MNEQFKWGVDENLKNDFEAEGLIQHIAPKFYANINNAPEVSDNKLSNTKIIYNNSMNS
jgi:hypothetical protein